MGWVIILRIVYVIYTGWVIVLRIIYVGKKKKKLKKKYIYKLSY